MVELKHKVLGSVVVASVGAAIASYYLIPPSSPRKAKSSKTGKFSKYKKTFEKHPFGVVWACDEEYVSLYVAADQKNVDLGLKIGSMLMKIGDQRVAGDTMQTLTEKLRRVKDFPIELQFLEQPKLEEAWTNSQTFRRSGKKFYVEQKFAEALLEYDKAIELHPTMKLLYSNKVLCLLKLDQFELALQTSHDMLKLDPYYPKGHYLKGSCHLEVAKAAENSIQKSLALSHAVSELRTCLRRQPENQVALAKLKESQALLEAVKEQIKIEVEKEIQERKEARERLMTKFQGLTAGATATDAKAEDGAEANTEDGAEAKTEDAELEEILEQSLADNAEVASEDVKIEAATEAVKSDAAPENADESPKKEETAATEAVKSDAAPENADESPKKEETAATEAVKSDAAPENADESPKKEEISEPDLNVVENEKSEENVAEVTEDAKEEVEAVPEVPAEKSASAEVAEAETQPEMVQAEEEEEAKEESVTNEPEDLIEPAESLPENEPVSTEDLNEPAESLPENEPVSTEDLIEPAESLPENEPAKTEPAKASTHVPPSISEEENQGKKMEDAELESKESANEATIEIN